MAVAFDHVVLGAAGGTGSAVVRELAARGLRVGAVTRGGTTDTPEGVEQVAADVGTAEGARRACEDAAVVYHCAQPGYTQWPELFPPMTRAIIDGAAAAGAKLVFADNLYVYGPPDGPMTEETPQRAQGKKGRTRIEMADAVLAAHADRRLRCTIGRSSDYYGPRSTTSTVGDNIMKPVVRGKRARWLGSLDQPHTLNYAEDMARALVTLGERDEADGQVWHLPAAEPLTGRQFLALSFEAAGHPPKIGVASRPMIRMAGLFNPLLRELNETLYQYSATARLRPPSPRTRWHVPTLSEPTPRPEAVRLHRWTACGPVRRLTARQPPRCRCPRCDQPTQELHLRSCWATTDPTAASFQVNSTARIGHGHLCLASALSPRRHSRRECRSPPYPEAAKVAARNACGETKAGASRLTAFALLLAVRREVARIE